MFGAAAEEAPWKGTFEVTLSPSVLQSHDGCFSSAGLAKDEERPEEAQESRLPSNSGGKKTLWFAQVWEENPFIKTGVSM